MSKEVRSRAIVLQKYPFQEHHWILRLYTEEEGLISVLTRGRKSTQFPAGALIRVRLHLRPQRELQRLAEAEWDYLYQRLFQNPQYHPYLWTAVEWLQRCLVGRDPLLFAWVHEQLITLDNASDPHRQLINFLVELLPRLGGKSLETTPLSLSEVEKAYAAFFPEWKPLRSLSIVESLTLPIYEQGCHRSPFLSSFGAD
ncbi:MAG: DNA repair protein RecO [Bacteroidia bacterium]|nr:DNA repair protein RecO [Bacteroidia bacterium]MDW8235256.1 recombination protein O N-terminal domain-containing protein [Bacteroidia bacterium]